MDPVLEEMQRAKDIRPGYAQKWARYFAAVILAKDAEIAELRQRLGETDGEAVLVKRGPGRPRKDEAHVA